MYQQFFGFDSLPFKITPDERSFFAGAERQEMIDALLYAINLGEGFVTVIGEVGIGKTTLARVLVDRFKHNFSIVSIFTPNISPIEMLSLIAEEAGLHVEQGASKVSLMRAIQAHCHQLHQQGKRFLLLIDEAQTMLFDTIEELRLLSNLQVDGVKLVQVLLFGQPELERMLNEPELRQVKDRIVFQIHIEPFSVDEVADYIEFRLKAAGFRGQKFFPDDVIHAIFQKTHGYPRAINRLADQALMAAFAEQEHHLRVEHVEESLQEPMQPLNVSKPISSQGNIQAKLTQLVPWLLLLIAVLFAVLVALLTYRFIIQSEKPLVSVSLVDESVQQKMQQSPSVSQSVDESSRKQESIDVVNAHVDVVNALASGEALKHDAESKQESNLATESSLVAATTEQQEQQSQIESGVEAINSIVMSSQSTQPNNPILKYGNNLSEWRALHQQQQALFSAFAGQGKYAIQMMSSPWRLRQEFVIESTKIIETLPKTDAFYYDYSATVDRPRIAVVYGVFDSKEEAGRALTGIKQLGMGYSPELISYERIVSLMEQSLVLEEIK